MISIHSLTCRGISVGDFLCQCRVTQCNMTGHYFQPKVRDAIIIKTDNKNRGTLPLAVVTGVYPGKDDIVRAVEL